MSTSVVVNYDLRPPADTPSNDLSSTKTHEFAVAPEGKGYKAYYEALRKAVLEAKSTLGEELTVWRDTVGKLEQGKEAKLPKKVEEEEEEGEGDEEGEEE